MQLDSPADLALAAAMGGMGDMPDAAESAAAAGGLTGDVENDALLPHACLVPGMLGTPSCQDALLREFMADLEDEAMGGDSTAAASTTSCLTLSRASLAALSAPPYPGHAVCCAWCRC